MAYKVISVRAGAEDEFLKDGYEPFAVSPHDTSYPYFDTASHQDRIQHQTTDYIYLRKKIGKGGKHG